MAVGLEHSSQLGDSRPHSGEEIRSAFLKFFSDRGHLILPSSSLVPDDPTVLLTIAGMLPFKPVFLGQIERPAARAASSQKCIRTNDIENVGVTARHHTFFEMLGNFSFGDYFKKEAIQWAWELSTNVYGLDPRNLVVSVFRDDNESALIWRDVVGVHPNRIVRMDEADNFWSSGPTGPCGPCSELYYDFHPEQGDLEIDLEDDSRFIEFYNLVFMQYNRDSEGTLQPLENCNIDTGMGLERMAQILQGVSNNYETDLIFPIVQAAATLAGLDYQQVDNKIKSSLKVIGDHSRAVTQLICDGVTASNVGRGYVLRRLLRRVVRHGRLIGIDKPFLTDMGQAAIELMKKAYPQLLNRRPLILEELEREEFRFLETLERGEKVLSELLADNPKLISGKEAFELYDTYGFPLELTQEIAQEHNVSVDIDGFEHEMNAQRQRAKAANISIDLTHQDAIENMASQSIATNFNGYTSLKEISTVKALVVNGQLAHCGVLGDRVEVVLDQTAFYGESGGQIGDCGVLINQESKTDELCVDIHSVSRKQGVFIHSGLIKKGTLNVGDNVVCKVNPICRRRIQANHTATHLLQSALKMIVDSSIGQAGSLVNFDRLRFDFHAPRPVSITELEEIETLINSWISESHSLDVKEMAIELAKEEGAIAMFGEKYGDYVRVVDVPGVSKELCGGTHVRNTSEIGVFKIISESGIAAGIRRVEAVAGPAVLDYLNERDGIVKQLGERLKTQPVEIVQRVVALQEEMKEKNKELQILLEDLALAKALNLRSQATVIGHTKVLVERLDEVDGTALQNVAKSLIDNLGKNAVVVLGGQPDLKDSNKVIFVAAFGSDVIAIGLHAGKFINDIAKSCGGGGGGRPALAQAGGRNALAIDQALNIAQETLKCSLS